MTSSVLSIRKLYDDSIIPYAGSAQAAGLDLHLHAPLGVTLLPFEPTRLPTGISVEIPVGSVGQVWDRSGLGSRGIRTLAGVIDADYRGQVYVCLINLTEQPIALSHRDRIAQLLVMPLTSFSICVVEHATETDRGEAGFGSTGR